MIYLIINQLNWLKNSMILRGMEVVHMFLCVCV